MPAGQDALANRKGSVAVVQRKASRAVEKQRVGAGQDEQPGRSAAADARVRGAKKGATAQPHDRGARRRLRAGAAAVA